MKKASLRLSLLLAFALVLGSVVPAFAESEPTPLVYTTTDLSQKFSPFYHDSAFDTALSDMVQIYLVEMDRTGALIYNGIEGETKSYNGVDHTYTGPADLTVEYDEVTDIATYTAKLREDIVFSDGVPLTADDLIFTYYVLLDTAYTGSGTVATYPIIGLESYRTQIGNEELLLKYNDLFKAIYEAGEIHEWSDADAWTQETQEWLWSTLRDNWIQDVQGIVDYIYDGYGDGEDAAAMGVTEDETLKVALAMALYGFGEYDAEAGTLTAPSGSVWTLKDGDVPTVEDFYAETVVAYEGDAAAYWEVEKVPGDSTDVLGTTKQAFIIEWGQKDESNAGGVPNIAGIRKLDDYTVEIKTKGFEAPAAYQIFGPEIAPLHYYGDPEQYDYENNQFGFPRGDLSIVESKTTVPLGAGPYKFVKYENKVAYLEANPLYWKGEPATKYIQFKETLAPEVIPAVQTATADFGIIQGTMTELEQIASLNDNGEITGNVMTTMQVDNRGYGYIGINAAIVKVGDDPFSEESKNLRKAIATIMAVYRDVAYDTFYGATASVINYPISNTSWAAPQPTDEDYKVAFSVDVNGEPLYTADMTAEDKYVVAANAAKDFLLAAGYTFDEASGKFTEAPEGASMTYELLIAAQGVGSHPSFAVVTEASNALEQLGITLKITDLADFAVLLEAKDAGVAEFFVMAWQTTPDPDMYQTYHSSNMIGKGGTNSNAYNLDIPELDQLIVDARKSPDQAYRKAIYKQALDIVVDAAVEIPCYQRKNSTLFSTERIDIDTVTPGYSTYWDWIKEPHTIMLNANK